MALDRNSLVQQTTSKHVEIFTGTDDGLDKYFGLVEEAINKWVAKERPKVIAATQSGGNHWVVISVLYVPKFYGESEKDELERVKIFDAEVRRARFDDLLTTVNAWLGQRNVEVTRMCQSGGDEQVVLTLFYKDA